AGSMKNENAFGPAKNTTVSPMIRVFQMLPCCRVRSTVNANGSLRNLRAWPRYGAPIDPGGTCVMAGHRTTEHCDRMGRAGLFLEPEQRDARDREHRREAEQRRDRRRDVRERRALA